MRLGTVAKAAEEMRVTTSAVSQQIRLLERQFGVLLFRRHNRRLIPTEEGERLFNATSQTFRLMDDVHSALVRRPHGRQFIMRVSPSFGECWLASRMKPFLDQNPGWSFRVDATPEYSDFENETVDLDLRCRNGSVAGLHDVIVIRDLIMPMCSPDLMEKLNALSDDPVEQLRQAQLIDSAKAAIRWDFWLKWFCGDDFKIPNFYALRFDRSSMSMQLAVEGAGVVLESAVLAWPELLSGKLVPFSNKFDVIEYPGYRLMCPPRHTNRRLVRLFSDWLVQEGSKHTAELHAFFEKHDCRIVPLSAMGGEDHLHL